MIWSEFQESVRTLLTVDAQRKGAGIQNYIDSVILSGVIELQQYIPSLRSVNRDTFYYDQMYKAKDIELSGLQQGFTKGRGKITKAVVLKPKGDKVISIPLNRWPWSKRNSMSMGCLSDCRSSRFPGKIMEDKTRPGGFYVYPEISPDELLILDWEGVKTDFSNTDETIYDHRVVKVVSDYAKAHIVREVDKDIQLYNEYYGMYVKERSVLFLDEKDMSLFDMPSVSEGYYNTCCLESETTDRLVGLPNAPQITFYVVSPRLPPNGLSHLILPNAPDSLLVDNCKQTDYHLCAISNSDAQVTIAPSSLDFSLLNDDGTVYYGPTGLHPYVGVASAPDGLQATLKAQAPTGIRSFVLQKPIAPTILVFRGLLADSPTGLGTPPSAPTTLVVNISANPATTEPLAPSGLDYLPVAPGELGYCFSNITGTICFPDEPTNLNAIHDGQGGGWVPDAPRDLLANVEAQAPNAPDGLARDFNLLVLVKYVYNEQTKEFERQEHYLVNIDPRTGATLDIQ